jgi:DNA-directed RNA polymerase specialized sigma24 family protein
MRSPEQPSSDATSPRGLFPTTRWTIVSHLGNGERRLRFVAWDEFFRSYQRPLYLWLLARMGNPHEAEELVQSFLTKLHVKPHALDALDASKGQLRSWLLTCLRRHWIDEWRARDPATTGIPQDTEDSNSSSDDTYDREWAFSLSRRVLDGLRIEYQARGKTELFEELLKALDTPEESNRAAICKQLEISENLFAVAYMRFRERLAVRLREEVAATVIGDDAGEIDGELRYLIGILSRQGGLMASRRDQ